MYPGKLTDKIRFANKEDEQELAELITRCRDLLVKMRRIVFSEQYRSIYTIAKLHGAEYKGETINGEIIDQLISNLDKWVD